MNKTAWTISALLASALGCEAAGAAPMELKYAYPGVPRAAMYEQTVAKWVEDINKASQGAVEIKLFVGPQLATFGNVMDRVQNGVAELGWALVGPYASQFPKTNVATLPFEINDPEQGAVALWKTYERGLIADEFTRFKLLSFAVFSNVPLHIRSKPVHTLADIRGMKIGIEGRIISQVVERLGGAPVTHPVTEVYQSLSRGVIDAAATGWPAVVGFKLAEVSTYHIDVPLGSNHGFVFMGNEAYAKLPASGREAFDKLSFETLTRATGKAIAAMEEEGRGYTRSLAGQTIAKLEPAEEARWREAVKPVTEQWVAETPNGAAILAAFREELAKARTR